MGGKGKGEASGFGGESPSEKENTKMLMLLGRIACKIGVVYNNNPSLEVLKQATSLNKLVEQIESADLECGPEPTPPVSVLEVWWERTSQTTGFSPATASFQVMLLPKVRQLQHWITGGVPSHFAPAPKAFCGQ